MCFPRKGTLTLGGPFRTPQIPENHKQIVRTKIVHTYEAFFEQTQKLIFEYVPIYRKRQQIRIQYSKQRFIIQNTPKTPKYISNFRKFRKIVNRCFFLYISNFHNFFLLYSIYFVYVLYILYFQYLVQSHHIIL